MATEKYRQVCSSTWILKRLSGPSCCFVWGFRLFYEDAVNAAQILEIALTSRNKNSENPIPMAGVPYHSAQQYIDVLIESGYKVAIAEQMEDPKQAVGVVKRRSGPGYYAGYSSGF